MPVQTQLGCCWLVVKLLSHIRKGWGSSVEPEGALGTRGRRCLHPPVPRIQISFPLPGARPGHTEKSLEASVSAFTDTTKVGTNKENCKEITILGQCELCLLDCNFPDHESAREHSTGPA